MRKYQGLINYIEAFEKEYELKVIIKDYLGFLEFNKMTLEYFNDYYIHKSTQCMIIKQLDGCWKRCYDQKDKIYKYLQVKKKPFFGTCYAGVTEFVYPIYFSSSEGNIFNEKILIGSINVGSFYSEEVTRRVNKLGLEARTQHRLIKECWLRKSIDDFDLEELEKKVETMSYLVSGLFYEEEKQLIQTGTYKNKYNIYILNHAIAYIENNFMNHINLQDIAEFCHCSKSLLSHTFKKNKKKTIRAYINEMRIHVSKQILQESNQSILDIALSVGYKDSNYFCKVFTNIEGIPPTTYRKQVQDEK